MKGIADSLQRLEAKVDLLATKADIQAILISAKGKKVPAMKTPTKAAYDSEDSYMDTSSEDESSSDEEPAKKPAAKGSSSSVGGNVQTISVRGFDSSLPLYDIKSALSKYFGSFGEITRVFVPLDRETGASLGYAYIDLKEGAEEALKPGRHEVRGWNLVVGMAEPIRSGSTWPFPGRCGSLGFCGYC
ncbi:RNA recognition motif domain [Arabidopsis thaliana x Arabidopsis arenosa]|uniref:RNA recognition motif domain n=1 Tax=Arabidopsis thaliana x Arabidopsis arenosa TaxID=1240361 RepID=A0A8T2BJ19_9BRAS|nr:RNA recognition motif domain [Arabidopsis thaliana x Arabidopsis arenosa]